MKGTKSIFASRTFYGIVIAVLGTAMGYFGYDMNEAMQGEMGDIVSRLVTIGGAIFAIYGRFKATKRIG